ncbi:MAG TPA: MFS transporter [Vicinamibacteria bacterium]|jgi:MFS family permease
MAAPLPGTVKRLGAVSLLTDASSEMIVPLLPAFVTGVLRAGPAFLGLVEGAAEATAALLKVASGYLSDRLPRRKPLVVAGYTLSSLARPLMAVASTPGHVLAIRVLDRFGKGTRGAPRDALLAAATPPAIRGRAFGFHRAMDHAGAMLGPLLAAGLLLWTADLRVVFALAAVPALLSVAVLTLGVHETAAPPPRGGDSGARGTDGNGRGLGALLGVLAVFALGNSSDAFLLLRAQEAGVGLVTLPLLWTWHHLVKSAASTYGGGLSDRWGRRPVMAAGWIAYAAAYAGFALAQAAWQVWVLFALYGLFHALTEGAEKALVADFAPAARRGRAFGLYHGVTGAMLLPASLMAGVLWERYGAAVALGTGAALSAGAAVLLLAVVPSPPPAEPTNIE